MLGCGFTNTLEGVPDDMDDPNFYTCGCSCVVDVPLLMRVSANLDDAEQAPQRGDDTDGAGDLDMGEYLGARFTAKRHGRA
jgi:hypothetical protein